MLKRTDKNARLNSDNGVQIWKCRPFFATMPSILGLRGKDFRNVEDCQLDSSCALPIGIALVVVPRRCLRILIFLAALVLLINWTALEFRSNFKAG